ncbi:MAG: class I SAM-dependent methyltransferase [Planctomycetes bacterium]|nr:class I SAM-dependent methyltransferase [Planctomycetota bacterium]
MLKRIVKRILKRVMPSPILFMIWKIPFFFHTTVTYIYFLLSKKKGQRLSWDELDELEKEYYAPHTELTLQSRTDQARHRIESLLQVLPQGKKPDSLLETGAGHGLLSITVHREFNINATAIDLNFNANPELEKNEIPYRTMNVSQMDFADNTFDCVVSFDAFEHFMEPDTALREMIRVTKPKGFIYLDFGPIYYSAFGLHVYKCVHVPYSQYLFDYEMMEEYIEKNDLRRIVPKTLNRWRLDQYNQLWESYCAQVDIVHKRISKDCRHLKLVRAYPGLFKAQTKKFSDLTNCQIQILFQKK